MAIVTLDYYTNVYFGEPIAEEDFPRHEATAERVIKQITHGRAANYAALCPFQQEAVQTAICAQMEYYSLYGIDLASAGRQDGGFTVGKVRIDGASAGALGARSMTAPAAIAALEQTGLLNPAAPTLDPLNPGWGWGL